MQRIGSTLQRCIGTVVPTAVFALILGGSLLTNTCLRAQVFSQRPVSAEQPIVTNSTPSAAPIGSSVDPLALSQVERIRKEPKDDDADQGCHAGLNDEIWVDARNLQIWLSETNKKLGTRLPPQEVRDLVLFFNGSPMPATHPNYVKYDGEITNMRFRLDRTKDSLDAWSRLWRHPVFERRLGVSVGFANGEQMRTLVLEDTTHAEAQFSLIIVRQARFWAGVSVLAASLIIFIWLARKDIVRDTTGPKRPDNKYPYSLARSQMAFWFFLVIASFFFLWVLTGSMNTLTPSVLALIGISAGTALGAALVDAGDPYKTEATTGNVPSVDLTKPRHKIVEQLNELIKAKQEELQTIEKKRPANSGDKPALDQNEKDLSRVTAEIKELQSQKGYFSYPAWRGVVNDLLGEKGVITFHRFQMFVWTLLLGIIFIISVYNDLAMPTFDATLLGLLGISAGTYVGFKIPEQKQAPAK